jgi:hypothetical protein
MSESDKYEVLEKIGMHFPSPGVLPCGRHED